MTSKTAITKITSLLKQPSFTSKEAHKFGVTPSQIRYYIEQGKIVRLGHGLYRGTNAPTLNDYRFEDLIFKVCASKNGVVCLTSALAIYDLTEEIPRQHWIAITNSTRFRTDSSVRVVRMRNMELGKSEIMIEKIKVPIFDKERTIVDAFRYLSLETAVKSLRMAVERKGKEKINIQKIKDYARILRVKIEPYLLAVTV